MKRFNIIHANNIYELGDKVLSFHKEANEQGFNTHTIFDKNCEGEYAAIVTIPEILPTSEFDF